MDETVSTVSILSGLIKGFSYYTLAQIFPEFHSWDWFSLEGKTIFEGDKGGKVGRKKSPMQLCRRIDFITVLDAIWTSRQPREKLQCLYENLIAHKYMENLKQASGEILSTVAALRIY